MHRVPAPVRGGRDCGGDLRVDGEGETLPWETEVLRKDDERIFDWIDSEGWRPWPRGASRRAGCGSASGSGEVGAGGMGSMGDSMGSSCFSSASDSAGSSGMVLSAGVSCGFSSAGVSAGEGSSAPGVGSSVCSVDSGSLEASASLGVSVAPEPFLLAFFFCFWSWATCTNTARQRGTMAGGRKHTLFLAAASFSALTRSSSSAMVNSI